MSDWGGGRRGWVKPAAIIVAALCGAAVMFGVGRWTAPAPAPASSPGETRQLPLTDQGVPYGYSHTQAGARAAAVNALIGGLRLREAAGSSALQQLGATGQGWSPALRLLLNIDQTVCVGLDSGSQYCGPGGSGNPQRQAYDFAPDPAVAGTVSRAFVTDAPGVSVATDGSTATVTANWLELRLLNGQKVWRGSNFRLSLVWQADDWKISDVTAVPVELSKPALPWLTVLGFIGQDRP